MKVQSNNVLQGERVPDVKPPSKEAGLDDAQVRARYGNPEVINTDIVNGVVKEQYVFRGPGGTTYVYMRDGRSYAVQHRPARRASADATCYSDRDIWNAGVGINSQSLPPGERERREREVERMTANKCSR
ncbi:MAG TPA: hypothetical protein VEZ89_12780 [Rubrivivax sp.]|nr:hypothetical protein [Rubrivivax sp.]